MRYGASPEAWSHFADRLDLKVDLLPVVSNPNAEISPFSKMKGVGKTPSIYNRDGKVTGFAEWTKHYTTNGHLQFWMQQPDYGIALQTRRVRAIDIDVVDPDQADAIGAAIIKALDGTCLPSRIRSNSGKRLLAFRFDEAMPKRVIPVEGGIIEFLGDGQQFIAIGQHASGVRYEWDCNAGLPASIPTLTAEELDAVWQRLVLLFATGEPSIAREKRSTGNPIDLDIEDPVADWLTLNWEVKDNGPDGQLYIACPFADEHTSDSGPSSTAYFPAGTGGYHRGHFVCLHAHCAGREDHNFLAATGYGAAQFDDLSSVAILSGDGTYDPDQAPLGPIICVESSRDEPWPRMVRDKQSRIEPTAHNMVQAFEHGGMIGRWIAYDGFTDELCWADRRLPLEGAAWKRLTDAEVTYIRMELEQRGFKAMSAQLLRDSLFAAGKKRAMDSAIVWLERQTWDGVPRIDDFAIDCWGWEANDYARAVGAYVWTALAGRTLEPGVQADMAPILVGAQGIKKTSAIKAMAPHPDMYSEIRLDAKDDDQSRALRGKVVGEIEELRGLNSRAIEEIKAFISRRRESWVPKFKEFENHFSRRCLLIGSTNEAEFLADPTGERRWLPGVSHFIDLERVRETRDQLWAEGAVRFGLNGVEWEEAERLAEREHPRYKISDTWERRIKRWIDEADPIDGPLNGVMMVDEIMSGALGIAVSQQDRRHAIRVEKALQHLGYKRSGPGWILH